MRARPCHRQRGLAVVELALLLPIMLFFMFAVAELGRVLYQYNALTKAVRDSAQYLARHGMIVGTQVLAPTPAQETTARNLVVYGTPAAGDTALVPGLSTGDVAITYQRLYGSGTDNAVTVTVNYGYQPLFDVLPDAFTALGGSVAGDQPVFTVQTRMRGV